MSVLPSFVDRPLALNWNMENPGDTKGDLQGPTNIGTDIILETTGLSPA